MRNVNEFQNFAAWYNLHTDIVRFVNQNSELGELHKRGAYDMLMSVLDVQSKLMSLGIASEKTDFSQQQFPGLYQLVAPTPQQEKKYHGVQAAAQKCLRAFQAVATTSSGIFPVDIQQRLHALQPEKKASRLSEPSFA